MHSRRTRRPSLLAGCGVALALMVTGCGDDPEPTAPQPSAVERPDGELEAEAQQSASFYAHELSRSLETGEVTAELRARASDEVVSTITRDAAELQARDISASGEFAIDVLSIDTSQSAAGRPLASVLGCLDASETVARGSDGDVIAPGDVPRRQIELRLSWRNADFYFESVSFPETSSEEPSC